MTAHLPGDVQLQPGSPATAQVPGTSRTSAKSQPNQERFSLSVTEHVRSCPSFQPGALSTHIIHILTQLPVQTPQRAASSGPQGSNPPPWLLRLVDLCVSDLITRGFREAASQIRPCSPPHNYTQEKPACASIRGC